MSTKKIKFIELNYHYHGEFNSPEEVINKHLPSNLFAQPLTEYATICLVKHLNYEGSLEKKQIRYRFFRRSNRFTQIPSRTHRFIKQENPDLVLVQGFIFPIQLMFLRRSLSKNVKILLQHHGEQPGGKKIHFQRIADRYVDGYLFSSIDMAEEWTRAKVIRDKSKCFEMPSASTFFSKKDKNESRIGPGMTDGLNFLWVGRLNENKDPLTVLKAFDQYCQINREAKLWMLFTENDLLAEMKSVIIESVNLKDSVQLVGDRPHAELESWFSGADYYISSSHREGGSYALTEAMACGCIPIVTRIPASMKAIDDGKAGYFFEPRDVEGLLGVLKGLDISKQAEMSEKVLHRFKEHFSAGAIAKKLLEVYNRLRP